MLGAFLDVGGWCLVLFYRAFSLVLLRDLVKVNGTMKKIYAIMVMLGLFVSVMLTGCGGSDTTGGGGAPAATNAVPTTPPATNK
jgi:hypothetical protein